MATDLEGKVVGVIGIKPGSQRILLNLGPARRRLFVKPNQTIFVTQGGVAALLALG
jgi:hypothetical protein